MSKSLDCGFTSRSPECGFTSRSPECGFAGRRLCRWSSWASAQNLIGRLPNQGATLRWSRVINVKPTVNTIGKQSVQFCRKPTINTNLTLCDCTNGKECNKEKTKHHIDSTDAVWSEAEMLEILRQISKGLIQVYKIVEFSCLPSKRTPFQVPAFEAMNDSTVKAMIIFPSVRWIPLFWCETWSLKMY